MALSDFWWVLLNAQFELMLMALVTSKYTQLKIELHESVVEVNILIGVYSVVVLFPTMYICMLYDYFLLGNSWTSQRTSGHLSDNKCVQLVEKSVSLICSWHLSSFHLSRIKKWPNSAKKKIWKYWCEDKVSLLSCPCCNFYLMWYKVHTHVLWVCR